MGRFNVRWLLYSPDGTLFCSAGKADRRAKVWYEIRSSYSFIYLQHPQPIRSLEWRRVSKFTPRGAVPNVLMTSCEDSKVRIWVQTILPDLTMAVPQFHLAAIIEETSIPHWINNKEIHFTWSLETLLQDMLARILKDNERSSSTTPTTTNDIELDCDDTLTAETSKKLRHKLCRKINKQRALAASGRLPVKERAPDGRNSPTSLAEEFDRKLEALLQEWRSSADLIFSIDYTDGTLISRQLRYLDDTRQVSVEEYSRLKSAIPIHEATTMSDITAYSPIVSTEKPNLYMVTQHVSGTLCLWKLDLLKGAELVTKVTGLPISPEWLQDGLLEVEFDEDQANLVARWNPDVSKLNEIENYKPFVGARDYYKASQLAGDLKILPQYHLKQLVELLAFGKLQRVKAILNHLVNCLAPSDRRHDKKRAQRSRTYSIANQNVSFHESLELDDPSALLRQTSKEEIELDYVEVTSIKPLPLHSLLEADAEKPTSGDGKTHLAHEEFSNNYEDFMFSKSAVDETLDEILGKSTLDLIHKQKEMKRLASEDQGKGPLASFNPKKARQLTRILTHTHIPGLTNVDQMHLLAVADAVAFFDASPEDLSELQDEDSNDVHGCGAGGMSMISTNIAIDSLDERGLRFLTAMRQYVYLTKCLPMKQRSELRQSGIGSKNIVWAFHSETQDELIGLIPCIQRNKADWAELREFGIGWWLKKLEFLKRIIDKVAQAAYQARQDPLDAALFYLAMKKKTLVCALLRRTNCDKRLLKLFEQDFNDPVNRKKALKNAYALLGLHRFEHAAAFFLLAGSIWDAVEVCINNLNDIQLAIVLIRLYDNDANMPSNLRRLLFTEILGSRAPAETSGQQTPLSPQGTKAAAAPTLQHSLAHGRKLSTSISSGGAEQKYNYDFLRAHQDPFLRSMAFWKLGDYLSAVHTLLEGEVNEQLSVKASIFNFYHFLKDQPLVSKHKLQLMEELEVRKRTSPIEEDQFHFHRARSLSSGQLGFEGIKKSITMKQSSTEFEVLNEKFRLVDKYSDEAVAENERRLFFATASSYLDSGCPLLALEVLCSGDHLNMGQAQRMKFLACLHVLLDELKTLAQNHNVSSTVVSRDRRRGRASTNGRGSSSSSGDADAADDDAANSNNNNNNNNADDDDHDDDDDDDNQSQDFNAIFKEWFERNLEALQSICPFSATATAPATTTATLDTTHCGSGGQEAAILRTMLTYCSLHFALDESMNLVRSAILYRLPPGLPRS